MYDLGVHKVTRKGRNGAGTGIDDPTPGDPPRTYAGCQTYPWATGQGTGGEENYRAATVFEGRTFLIPDVDADITSEDVLIWRGKEYDVEGEPGEWFYYDGDQAGLQVNTRRRKG